MSGIDTPQTRRHLIEVKGNIVLAALCVGQFHAPCQIDAERLLVLADQPLRQVLQTLGLEVRDSDDPFTPAPFFASETSAHGIVRRAVRTHASIDSDDYAPAEADGRGSNA